MKPFLLILLASVFISGPARAGTRSCLVVRKHMDWWGEETRLQRMEILFERIVSRVSGSLPPRELDFQEAPTALQAAVLPLPEPEPAGPPEPVIEPLPAPGEFPRENSVSRVPLKSGHWLLP